MDDVVKIILGFGIAYLVYVSFWGEESGCKEYSSQYSCEYVEEKAYYEVYYWRNVEANNPADEKYIASSYGLENCRNAAISYARSINEPWNNRSYICVLMKDGRAMEKHR